MRVEVYDEVGNRYTVTLEGRVTRDKAVRILDMVELLGGMPGVEPSPHHPEKLSKFERVHILVKGHFPLTWFSSKDIQSAYEEQMNEPISLSTVSTYLSRLTDRGVLVKTHNSNRISYRLMSKDMREMIEKV